MLHQTYIVKQQRWLQIKCFFFLSKDKKMVGKNSMSLVKFKLN
jgi:hypothetical protein